MSLICNVKSVVGSLMPQATMPFQRRLMGFSMCQTTFPLWLLLRYCSGVCCAVH